MSKNPNAPVLNTNNISDPTLQRNFQNLVAYYQAQGQLDGFQGMDLIFTAKQTNFQVAHGLGVIPTDLILSLLVGTGSFTMNWGLCTATQLNISVSGPCRARFLIGIQGAVPASGNFAQTDTQTWNPGG